jgi:hypothetical protein
MSDLEQAGSAGAGVNLRARSRPHGETDAETHEWVVEADTYERGRKEARLAVLEGWDLLSVQVLDDRFAPM